MRTDTQSRIIEYVQIKQQFRAHDLVRFLGLSAAATHRQLKRLIIDGVLRKTGTPPLVFYMLAEKILPPFPRVSLPNALTRIIDDNFLFITAEGVLVYGLEGFFAWARQYQSKTDILVMARGYADLVQTKQRNAPQGWIDGTEKMNETFHPSNIHRLLFADVYSYPVFGRTKLARLVMHAKQSANTALITVITHEVKPAIERIILEFHIEAVAFVPPTVPRPVQFMDEFAKALTLTLPRIQLAKIIPGDIPIPQKSLTSLNERVMNARGSIFPMMADTQGFRRILLIDDVVGSGASFQETARKLQARNIGGDATIAFAIVGNKKGYEVIRQL